MAAQMQIKFIGSIYSQDNEKIKEQQLAVEFFNVQVNAWLLLTNGVVTDSKFSFEYKIPLRISKNDSISRALKDVISSGSIPSFRLITEDGTMRKILLSSAYQIGIDDELLSISIDFKKNWLLPSGRMQEINKTESIGATNVFIPDNEEDFVECQQSRIEIEKELAICKKTIDSNEKEIASLSEQLQNTKDLLESCQSNNFEELSDLYNTLQKNFDTLQVSLDIEKENNKSLEDKLKSCNTEKKAIQEKLDQCIETSEEKTPKIKELEETISDLRKQLEECISEESNEAETLRTQITELLNQIKSLQSDKENQNNEIDKLKIQLEDCVSHQPENKPNVVEAKKVYSELVNELSSANESMKGMPYQLGSIKLNLKTVVSKSATGINFELLDSDEIFKLPPEAISTVEMSIDSKDESKQNIPFDATPNLIGLTETAVRKRLSARKLRLNPIYESFDANEGKIIGQSFKQIPEAGSEIVPGETVSVFFAKSKNI